MPNVDGQKFPYTAEGKRRAVAAAKAKKSKPSYNAGTPMQKPKKKMGGY